MHLRTGRGGVLVLNEQGAEAHWEPYALGLRNPVGFDWQPGTEIMYLTNNGPGHWGYRLPPDYFTRAHAGSFHGMPWFQYDGNRIRPDHCINSPSPRPLSEVTLPALTFPAHS